MVLMTKKMARRPGQDRLVIKVCLIMFGLNNDVLVGIHYGSVDDVMTAVKNLFLVSQEKIVLHC